MEDEILATKKHVKPELPLSSDFALAKVCKYNIQLFFVCVFSEVAVYVIVFVMKIMIYSGVKDVPRSLRKIIPRVSQNVCRSLSLLEHNTSSTTTLEPCRQRSREFLQLRSFCGKEKRRTS